jgi:hypothetical protein
MITGTPAALIDIYNAAQQLVKLADSIGVVVTVEQKPLQPLAMGHYETVVSVRPVVRK